MESLFTVVRAIEGMGVQHVIVLGLAADGAREPAVGEDIEIVVQLGRHRSSSPARVLEVRPDLVAAHQDATRPVNRAVIVSINVPVRLQTLSAWDGATVVPRPAG